MEIVLPPNGLYDLNDDQRKPLKGMSLLQSNGIDLRLQEVPPFADQQFQVQSERLSIEQNDRT